MNLKRKNLNHLKLLGIIIINDFLSINYKLLYYYFINSLPDLNNNNDSTKFNKTNELTLSLNSDFLSISITSSVCNFNTVLDTYRNEWNSKKLKNLKIIFFLIFIIFLGYKRNSFLYKLLLFLDPREHYFILCYLDVI